MVVTPAELVWMIFLGLASGSLGAVTGIGGGVIIVPALIVVFGFDFATAVAASLAAVIATSTAAGGAYVAEGLTNMRLAITLEVATTLGGITGGFLGVLLPEKALSGVFGAAMLATALLLSKGRTGHGDVTTAEPTQPIADIPADSGPLDARYRDPESGSKVVYRVRRVPSGMGASYGAGVVSGVLGVGAGFIKVPAMNLVMGVPIKVAAATSSFMIGVTAASSLLVYLGRGELHPGVTTPLVLGTVVGAVAGTRLQNLIPSRYVRTTLSAILVLVAIQMGLRAAGVGLG
jgi:uncharacterized membrane protein YfcA